jgi:pimeloyl-ACP methyl ester carboxylesterase
MLHYRRYDLGPEADWVVFVHGAGGSSSIWHRQLRAFKDRHNVLLVDLRGHGGSQHDEQAARGLTYTFDDVARDVLHVLDDLGVARAHFVGISLGSIVIRTLAELAPDRVASLTLGGAIVRLDFRSRFLVGAGRLLRRVVPFLWLYKLFAWVIMPRRRHRESRLAFVAEARRVAQREFMRWWRLTAEVTPLLRFFREQALAVPTLYVMGEEDYLFLPPVRQVVAAHAGTELAVIPDSGHVVNLDQPDAFNDRVLAFIARHRAGR